MSDVSLWPVLTKTNVVSTDYLPVTGKKRLQVATLFPSFATAGVGGEYLYTGITNKNQLNFKGLLSTHAAIALSTNASNVEFSLVPGSIDLSLCNNTTSLFLKTVSLVSNVTGTLPVGNGGTGLSTIPKGSILYAGALDNIVASTPMNVDGLLAIGHSGNGYPAFSTLTAGANVTITNGPGSITIAASITALLSTLDCATFGINLNYAAGASFISGDGTAEGMTVDTSGRVFMGDNVPTLPSLVAQLTLGGNATTALQIGNNNSYKDHTIKATNSTGASAGLNLTIEGADATVGNNNGGNVTVKAGNNSGTGNGGNLKLIPGNNGAGGNAGEVQLYLSTGGSSTVAARITEEGNFILEKGMLVDAQNPDILTGAGAVDITASRCHFTDTGANALTLANGQDGQHLYIMQVGTSGGAGTLTPTNLAGGTTITFNAIGDTVHLMFSSGSWFIVGQNGVVVA